VDEAAVRSPIEDTVRSVQIEHWDRIAAVEAAEEWTPRCRVCHRPMWSERSVRAGVGPRCAALEAAIGLQQMEG
jgi:hypothetical protein